MSRLTRFVGKLEMSASDPWRTYLSQTETRLHPWKPIKTRLELPLNGLKSGRMPKRLLPQIQLLPD